MRASLLQPGAMQRAGGQIELDLQFEGGLRPLLSSAPTAGPERREGIGQDDGRARPADTRQQTAAPAESLPDQR